MNNKILGFRALIRFMELGIGRKFVEDNTPLDPPLLGGTYVLETACNKAGIRIPPLVEEQLIPWK